MGACDIWFSVEGDKSESEIKKMVDAKRESNRSENGHQEGYSGDWQTVHGISFKNQVFESCEAAKEWCSSNCNKWSGVVVKYKSYGELKPNKNLEAIDKKLKELSAKHEEDKKALLKKIQSKPFVTCPHCKSKVNTKYTNNTCTVCNEFFPTRKKIGDKYEAKVKELQDKAKAEWAKLRLKSKSTIKWLVYGVAAC